MKTQQNDSVESPHNTTDTTNGQARFTDITLKHSYDIETVIDSQIAFITVDANTRSQAAAFAKKHGYVVRSVNMIG